MIAATPLQASQGSIIRQLRLNSAMAGHAEEPDVFAALLTTLRQRSDDEWNDVVAEFLADAKRMTFIGFRDGVPCGMIMCRCPVEEDGLCLFDLIWVNTDCRRKKVGSTLIEAARKWAEGQGAHTVLTWISEDNLASTSLHEQLAFVRTGHQRPDVFRPQKQEQQFSLALNDR